MTATQIVPSDASVESSCTPYRAVSGSHEIAVPRRPLSFGFAASSHISTREWSSGAFSEPVEAGAGADGAGTVSYTHLTLPTILLV